MSENTEITAEENKAEQIATLNKIFEMLVETTGMDGGADERASFIEHELCDEYYFAGEYWFTSKVSDSMKLLFSDYDGFAVIMQDRSDEGRAAVELANIRLVAMGLSY